MQLALFMLHQLLKNCKFGYCESFIMSKRRIFIAIHYLELGGAEISLTGLLQSLDYSKYDVDLFVYSHRGELMEFIPKQVNLLPQSGPYPFIEAPVSKALKSGYLGLVFRRLKAKIKYCSYKKEHPDTDGYPELPLIAREILPCLPAIGRKEGYDLAISYLQPHHIVLEKVKAKKKACWIHTDYSNVGVDPSLDYDVWDGYDHIVSISDSVTEGFLKAYPLLKDKIVLMQNILPSDFVTERAGEISVEDVRKEMPEENGVLNFLSVGRFSYAKNYDNVPDICSRIIAKGVNVRWYIIGFGTEENLIREKIKEAGMEGRVIILGKKANPYPYIKACDFYIQPSRYEGNSVTVREAQMLGVPVVITNYSTSFSQLKDKVDGFVVPLDNEGCARGIAEIIKDKDKITEIKKNLFLRDFSNREQIGSLEKLFE